MREGELYTGFLWTAFTVIVGFIICACSRNSDRKDWCANDEIYEKNITALDAALRSWRSGRRVEMMNKWYGAALLKQQEWRNLHVHDRTHIAPPALGELPIDKTNSTTRYDPFARLVLFINKQGEFVCTDRDYKIRKSSASDIIIEKKAVEED